MNNYPFNSDYNCIGEIDAKFRPGDKYKSNYSNRECTIATFEEYERFNGGYVNHIDSHGIVGMRNSGGLYVTIKKIDNTIVGEYPNRLGEKVID